MGKATSNQNESIMSSYIGPPMWMVIMERTSPEGEFHTTTSVYPSPNSESAAVYALKHCWLMEGWKVRSVKVLPYHTMDEWQVEPSAAWTLGRQTYRRGEIVK